AAGAKNWKTVENKKLITKSETTGSAARPNAAYEKAIPPRITVVAISTVRLSQRSTYTPASTPKTTDGMMSVSTARLSWVLELLTRCTRMTMPNQIAFWAVWLMACASHSSRKLRVRQIDCWEGPEPPS